MKDLVNPLYSGQLKEVRSNQKRWCVLKQQKVCLILYIVQVNKGIAFILEILLSIRPDCSHLARAKQGP